MKSEKIFEAITEIEDKYIDEANTEKIRSGKKHFWRWAGGTAACFAIAIAVGIVNNGGLGAAAGGGTNREPGERYMSYAGPAFPLAALESTEGLSFERSINFDFSPYYTYQDSYEDSDGEIVYYDRYNNNAVISDNYTVTNVTGDDIAFTAVYPFSGSMRTETERMPQITVDGNAVETELIIGPYSGGFASAWGENSEVERLNLSSIESWDEYKILLESGEYMKDAFEENPKMEQNVTVYSFGIEYNVPMEEFDKIDNPDMIVTFDYDTENSSVYFYGFNSLSWSSEEEWVKVGSYIPKSFNPDFENHPVFIIVMGDDIDNIDIKTVSDFIEKYDDERVETSAFSVTTEKYESTLGEVIFEIISSGDYESHYFDDEPTVRSLISNEEYLGYVAEFMYAHGHLSEDPAERYFSGRLDDVISETGYVSRVLYVTFEVTIPAGETVEIGTKTLREASFDFYGAGRDEDMNGFDMVTKLGTNLNITKQTASVSNTGQIEIAYNNFGFDLENGITEVLLGDEEHYWMEVVKIYPEE
ncbi:MAG: hypothetical protein IJF04_00640 [Oscillospiraceae bacterium]|nr:hypothetical protein [Oscillospiraceae bacterium]MBQ3236920.1 hypothetical protein [Oscillospiraceae bacterium]